MILRLAAFSLFVSVSAGALADDGCPDGSVDILPNGDVTSVFFDVFVATPAVSASCTLVVPMLLPENTFAVYSADYRGFVNPDDTGTLTIENGGNTDQFTIEGAPDDFVRTNYVGTNSDGNIVSDITLDLDSTDNGSAAALDTIDYLELGRTTLESVEGSLDDIATGRTGIVTHLSATANLLVGGNQPFERESSFGAIGALGSHTLGVTGHYNLGEGISLDGGAALLGQSVDGTSANGFLIGGEAKYLQPDSAALRLFAGAGFNAAPGMGLTFTRFYDDNSPDGATVVADTSGSLFSVYAEGGALFAPDPSNEIVFSASLTHSWLAVDGYTETFSEDNLFPASFEDSDGSYDTIKAKAAWTTKVGPDVDVTLTGAVGQTFANDDVDADVMFVGPVSVGGQSELFAEYGARVGWDFGAGANWSVFAQGSTGAASGTHMQAGTTVSLEF